MSLSFDRARGARAPRLTAPPAPEIADGGAAGAAVHARREVDRPTRWLYGFGSVAFGVKDNGFSYFLVFFYNQVMGVPAQRWRWRRSSR